MPRVGVFEPAPSAVSRRHASPSRVALAPDTVEQTLAFIDTLPPDGTASMQRDIMAGLPSELEAQVGVAVRLSERLGIPVPAHRRIYETLLPLERAARADYDA